MYEYIGIDISKSSLQVYLGKFDQDIEIENSPKGLKGLHAKVKKLYGKAAKVVWIYEPTGSYSSLTKRFCSEHNILRAPLKTPPKPPKNPQLNFFDFL